MGIINQPEIQYRYSAFTYPTAFDRSISLPRSLDVVDAALLAYLSLYVHMELSKPALFQYVLHHYIVGVYGKIMARKTDDETTIVSFYGPGIPSYHPVEALDRFALDHLFKGLELPEAAYRLLSAEWAKQKKPLGKFWDWLKKVYSLEEVYQLRLLYYHRSIDYIMEQLSKDSILPNSFELQTEVKPHEENEPWEKVIERKLTEKDRQIVKWWRMGKSDKEISALLKKTYFVHNVPRTIQDKISKLRRKCGRDEDGNLVVPYHSSQPNRQGRR
jgi:hypothetical protein